MKQYEIKRALWEFILISALGSVFLLPGIVFLYRSDILWGILVFVVTIKVFFYGSADFLFRKIIFENKSGLYIRVFYADLPLDKARSYIVIAPQSALIGGRKKMYDLLLVRNDKRYLKRIFKNRIKLYAENMDIDLEKEANNISQLFGLTYRGIDKSDEGLGYMDNDGDLSIPSKKWKDIQEEKESPMLMIANRSIPYRLHPAG